MTGNDAVAIAKILLQTKAVVFELDNPYTYVSGMRSPIYCDNRSILSYPEERRAIVDMFCSMLSRMSFDIIVGTATAGIPWATLIADRFSKPLAYVRSEKKKRGMGKQIEGAPVAGMNAIVIEDLISTGGSSFKAVEALREEGLLTDHIAAIFTYDLPQSHQTFKEGNCNVIALTSFPILVKTASEMRYLSKEQVEIVEHWNRDPFGWGPKFGFPNAKPGW